jgi:hypothetical protein
MNFERSESSLRTPSSSNGTSDLGTQTESNLLPGLLAELRFMQRCIYQIYKMSIKILIFLSRKKVYKSSVPNQRAPGQKLMPIPVDEQFLKELDAGMVRAGYRNRSKFVRDAIVEKLKRAGISLPADLAMPPQRTGKTAPAKIHYPAHKPSGYVLNERMAKKRR